MILPRKYAQQPGFGTKLRIKEEGTVKAAVSTFRHLSPGEKFARFREEMVFHG